MCFGIASVHLGFWQVCCYWVLSFVCSPRDWQLVPFVLRLYWFSLAFSSFGFSSKGFSKKFTSDCSVRRDAKICSKETVQSPSVTGDDWESLWGVFTVSVKTVSWSEAAASGCKSSVNSSDPLSRLMLLCPTSPICSNSVVTVAMAWYKSFSSGSSWNMLYKVLQNWMNSLCKGWDTRIRTAEQPRCGGLQEAGEGTVVQRKLEYSVQTCFLTSACFKKIGSKWILISTDETSVLKIKSGIRIEKYCAPLIRTGSKDITNDQRQTRGCKRVEKRWLLHRITTKVATCRPASNFLSVSLHLCPVLLFFLIIKCRLLPLLAHHRCLSGHQLIF